MSEPFGSRAILREQMVLDAFRNIRKESRTMSELAHICQHIDDKNEIEPVAAVCAAVVDLERYGYLEKAEMHEWWKQKKYKLTEKGRAYLKEHSQTDNTGY